MPKSELANFVQGYLHRTLNSKDITYSTVQVGDVMQSTVTLHCLRNKAYAGAPCSNEKDAENAAAVECLKGYTNEVQRVKAVQRGNRDWDFRGMKDGKGGERGFGQPPEKRHRGPGKGYDSTPPDDGKGKGGCWGDDSWSKGGSRDQGGGGWDKGGRDDGGWDKGGGSWDKGGGSWDKGPGKGFFQDRPPMHKGGQGTHRKGAPMGRRNAPPNGIRLTLSEGTLGDVIEWNAAGCCGTLRPHAPLEHPMIDPDGTLYVHAKDVKNTTTLAPGSLVQFRLYQDAKGLGACEVMLF